MPAEESKEIEDNDGGTGGLSRNLFVGNLSSSATDSDLMDIFAKYNPLDAIATYSSTNYAFVFFKCINDAQAAMDALQGTMVCGNPIKIKSLLSAKPGKHLWVGAISSSVAKEQLEDEFSKFGKIKEFKFLRDRNSALVDYYKLENAGAALKTMNGKHLGGEQIQVEFLRSNPLRNGNRPGFHEQRDGHFKKRKRTESPEWMPSDVMRNFHEPSHFAQNRHLPSQPIGGQREKSQPSKILWIGYPPSVQIDEQMLHNSMILFGEIERIKSFPSRHYSFVEFRSVEEAQRAKEGLQGRLFNDPRIKILFSSSEYAPGNDNLSFSPGNRVSGRDGYFNGPPFEPWHAESMISPHPIPPVNFRGHTMPNGMPGASSAMRPFGPNNFDPLVGGPFNDTARTVHSFPDSSLNNPASSNWRRFSPPAPGMLPSLRHGIRPPVRPLHGLVDGLGADHSLTEPKWPRIGDPSSLDGIPFHARMRDGDGTGDRFAFGPQFSREASGRLATVQINCSPLGTRGPSLDRPINAVHQGFPRNDYCWRGVIAKGGTPVCHALCVPIGNGLDSQLPEVVNCSARTGLDMLTKHYTEASGFDIVYFLPDSEEDFPSYTEFLHYLGTKNRAGVAKFDDGTTLFLVPPSEFLTQVLNVSGPERLYGLVLKFLQKSTTATRQQLQQLPPLPSHHFDREHLPPQLQYALTTLEDQILQRNHNRTSHEDLMPKGGAKPAIGHAESHSAQLCPMGFAGSPAPRPQAGVSLTPELIASLAALIPASTQSATLANSQLPLTLSVKPGSLPSSMRPDEAMPSQGWEPYHQAAVSGGLQVLGQGSTRHLEDHVNNQAPPLSQNPASVDVLHVQLQAAAAIPGSKQVQDPALKTQQAAIPSGPMYNLVVPSQGGQYSVSQSNPQYQIEASQISENCSTAAVAGAAGLLNPLLKVTGNSPQYQTSMTLETDKMNTELPTEVPQLQSTPSVPGQGSSETNEDKKQRYQSTLQFAASLLLQLQQQQQQQQQQANVQALQGSDNYP